MVKLAILILVSKAQKDTFSEDVFKNKFEILLTIEEARILFLREHFLSFFIFGWYCMGSKHEIPLLSWNPPFLL